MAITRSSGAGGSKFLLNPWEDITLDLKKKEDRQLFKEASTPLPDEVKCKGNKENWLEFSKIFQNELDMIRCA